MKKTLGCFFGLALIICLNPRANADVLFSDDFQDGTLNAWKNTQGTGNSVFDLGNSDWVGQIVHVKDVVRHTVGNNGTANSGLNHNQVYGSFDVKMFAGVGDFKFVFGDSNYSGGPEQILQMDLDSLSDARDSFVTFEVFLNNTSASMSYMQHGLSGSAAANTADIYVDGMLVSDDMALDSDKLNISAKSFGFIVNKGVASQTVQFDNVVIETVIPEPATVGLISAFGGGVLLIRRWFTL